MRQVLAWAIAHDPAAAVRLADALGGWWRLRGRLPGQYRLLSEIAGRAEPGSDRWCAIQGWLGWAAFLAFDLAGALDHFTAVRDAAGDWGPSRVLADALAGRAETLLSTGRLAEGAEDGRRSLAMARELGYPAGEGAALRMLAIAAFSSGDNERGVQLIRRQQVIAGVPGSIARAGSAVMIAALIESGDLAAAGTAGAAALAQCRDAGDLLNLPYMLAVMADLDVRAGHFQDAAAHLRDGLQIAVRAGDLWDVAANGLFFCAWLCTATGRYAEAATVWAAQDVHARQQGLVATSPGARMREEALSNDPAGARPGQGAGGRTARRGDEPGHRGRVRPDAHRPRPAASPAGPGAGEAQRPGTGAGHPGRPGPHRRPDRRPAVHQHPHRRARTWTGSGTRPAAAAAPT